MRREIKIYDMLWHVSPDIGHQLMSSSQIVVAAAPSSDGAINGYSGIASNSQAHDDTTQVLTDADTDADAVATSSTFKRRRGKRTLIILGLGLLGAAVASGKFGQHQHMKRPTTNDAYSYSYSYSMKHRHHMSFLLSYYHAHCRSLILNGCFSRSKISSHNSRPTK